MISLVAMCCRTSERLPADVEAFARMLGERLGLEPRLIGSPEEPRAADWREDLEHSRGCLLEAGGQVEDALAEGHAPVLVAGNCSICLTTLAALARRRPDARVLWLDAHGDFNTPETTPSGFLGGMCLAGACGQWDSGLAAPFPAERLVLVGASALDPEERELLERSTATVIGASLETLVFTQNALDGGPVFVHVDLDVLEPGGLAPDKLYDLLEAVAGECEVVGIEVAGVPAAEDAMPTALRALEPLLAAITEEAHVNY